MPDFPLPCSTAPTTSLPLFGEALIAVRLARRAALSMLEGDDQRIALTACDVMEDVARRGDGWRSSQLVYDQTQRLPRTRDTEAALDAVRWAFDSLGAAQGSLDFPVDAIVGASAQRCIDAVQADPRVSPMQIAILIHADRDLISFTCAKARIGTYDGLTNDVLGRLTPCHPLSLSTPAETCEEEAR